MRSPVCSRCQHSKFKVYKEAKRWRGSPTLGKEVMVAVVQPEGEVDGEIKKMESCWGEIPLRW